MSVIDQLVSTLAMFDPLIGALLLPMGAVMGAVIFNRSQGFGAGSLVCYRIGLAGLVYYSVVIGLRMYRGLWSGSLVGPAYWLLFAAGIFIGVRIHDRLVRPATAS